MKKMTMILKICGFFPHLICIKLIIWVDVYARTVDCNLWSNWIIWDNMN